MNKTYRLLFLIPVGLLVFVLQAKAATPWSGIIDPSRAIDWSTAGIPLPGGILPSASWSQSGSTITASQCGNGSNDCTATIQSALNSCGTDHYVLLGAGTFLLDGGLTIPGYCALRGAGADQTILNAKSTSKTDVTMGYGGGVDGNLSFANAVSITGGASQSSTNITVSSASHISVGSYLVIDQSNDGTIVNSNGSEGNCSWCDGGQTSNGNRAQGQIVEVTSVSGNNIGINPGLYVNYTLTPLAVPFTAVAKYAGVENLQIYANDTHPLEKSSSNPSNIEIGECAYCWVSGIASNYTDGNHIDFGWDYHDEVLNSYFSGTYGTGPGQYDHGIRIGWKSTGILIQNNIFDRAGILEPEEGTAGDVVAYNYMSSDLRDSSPLFFGADIEDHGAHPQFNLFEGNIVDKIDLESIWGSSADNTTFRNWTKGAGIGCNPLTGTRATVVCTPMGVQGAKGVNGWWQVQGVWAMDVAFQSTYNNFVGDVVGSAAMAALNQYNNPAYPMGQVPLVNAPAARSYDADAYGFAFGYGEAGDPGGVGIGNGVGCDGNYSYPCESTLPYSTAFMHGEYNNVNGSITWASGVTHTLPASFYLPSAPTWWGTLPWPANGPDVTGGIDAGGHANMNPAENCYFNVMGGSEGGAGSPLTFNPNNCYGSGGGDTTPPSVSITYPPNGATVSSTVIVSGVASDNVAVASVAISIDGGTYVSVSGTTSWTYSWNTTSLANGSHTLEAKATDTSGNVGFSSTISVTVNNPATPPSTPTGLIASSVTTSTISLSWTASTQGTYPIAGYNVYRCTGTCTPSTLIGTTATNAYTDTGLTASTTYTYAVSAYDTQGNASGKSSPLTVSTKANLDNTPPSIVISYPANNQTISGTVIVSGTASDNVAVSSVAVSIDGGSYQAASGTTSWTYSWNTAGIANGTHTITAQATDTSGNTSTASVTVNVQNSGSGLQISLLAVNQIFQRQATVSWTTNLKADSKVVYGTSATNLNLSQYNATLTTKHAMTITGLVGNTTYYLEAVSNDPGVGSATSSIISFTTKAKPNQVQGLMAQDPQTESVTLSWTDNDPTSTYASVVVVRRTDQFSTDPVADAADVIATLTPGVASYTDTAVSPGTTYYYSVFTEDSSGIFSDPTEIAMTTVSSIGGTGGGGTGGGGTGGGISSGAGSSGTGAGGGTSTIPPSSSSSNSSLATLLQSLLAQVHSLESQLNVQVAATFTRNLTVGSSGTDVTNLQVFLNNNGNPIATSGPGSPGNESTYFGTKTAQALAAWQKVNGLPGTGYFGQLTRAYIERQ